MAVLDVPKLLTLDEVAQRLRLSRRTVERLIAADLLPALRISHRSVRVDPGELETWLAEASTVQNAGSSSLLARGTPVERDGETSEQSAGQSSSASAPAGAKR
jgi:excisionase family DNA binding protein